MRIKNIGGHIAKPAIPKDYGHLNKRNYAKIDIYVSGQYTVSTTWAASTTIARAAYAEAHRVPLHMVFAKRADSKRSWGYKG